MNVGRLAAAGAGIGVLVGGIALASYLHDRHTKAGNDADEERLLDSHVAQGPARLDKLVDGSGMIAAEAAARLLRAHDLNDDGRLDATLAAPEQLVGNGKVSSEWTVWSQHAWPWTDPDAHVVHLFEHHAPETTPLAVRADDDWLAGIAGGDARVSREELTSFVDGFDRDDDGILTGSELRGLADATGAATYLTTLGNSIRDDHPSYSVSRLESELPDSGDFMGRRPDGVEVYVDRRSHEPADAWDIEREPTESERRDGNYRRVQLQSDIPLAEVARLLERDGVEALSDAVYH